MNILNKTALKQVFDQLQNDQKPVFGIMTPQHMVEHLILLQRISYGSIPVQPAFDEKTSDLAKQRLIYSDMEIRPGFKSPLIPVDDVTPLEYASLSEATDILFAEIENYIAYFAENPGIKTLHPITGQLDFNEWNIFHNKHFLHHCKQFELI